MKTNEEVFEALSQLSKLGKMSKEVELEGLKIELCTLDSNEEGEIFVTCADLTGNAYFSKVKSETLKYSIRAVNGKRLDEYKLIVEEKERDKLRKETLEKLQKILGTWDENVIAFLYGKWAELSKESEEDLVKKGIVK